jgi:ketosteroid isomerase-like protein
MRASENVDRVAIRDLINSFVRAIRAKDIDGVMAVFAPEVVSFDLGPTLGHGGGEAFVRRWQELFASYASSVGYEILSLLITACDGVAFSHSLNRVSGTLHDGRTSSRWLRWTACYRKTNDEWRIVHEHVSVPVDVKNGTAMLDLTP